MKKVLSLLSVMIMLLCLSVPTLAADVATFAVNVVSENDGKAIVSIDYEGKAAFNCLDFSVELSGNVTVEKASIGAGLRNFKIEAEDKQEGSVITAFNKDTNPIKFTFASLSSYKNVNGKDLLVLSLKKKSGDKLTENDVKLIVENCGVSIAGQTVPKTVTANTIQIGNKTATTVTAAGQAGTTVKKTAQDLQTTSAATTISGENTDANYSKGEKESGSEINTKENESDSTATKKPNRNKIIIISAAAVVAVAVIATVVVCIVKKKNSEE